MSAPAAPPAPSRRHWGRWLLLLVLGLALVVGVGLTFFLDPWLRRTLERQVTERSRGRYQLRVARLHTSLWRDNAELSGIRLRTVATSPDSARLPPVRFALAQLRVSGIGLLALVRRREVPIDSIALDSLSLHLAAWPRGGSKRPLHEQLPVPGIRVGALAMRHARVAYGPEQQPAVQLGEATVVAQDIWLSAAGAADSARTGYAAAVAAQLRGAALRVPGHELKLVRAAFSSRRQRLQLDSVLVHPHQAISNTRTPAVRLSLALPRLVLAGLDAAGLSRNRFRADTLRLQAPHLALTLPAQSPPTLVQMLQPYLRECRLNRLEVSEGQVRVAGLELAPAIADVQLSATKIQVLPRRALATDVLYARAWQVSTGRATGTLDAPYYHVSWQQLRANSQTKLLQVAGALVVPTRSVEALARGKGHQAAYVTVRLPEIRFSGLDFAAAANRQQLRATLLRVRTPRVSTRSDGRFPINPSYSVATPEGLGRLPFGLAIERLRVEGATINMSYRSPRDPQPGIMSIDRLGVELRNLSNDPRRMSAATPLTGEATGWVQNRCRARLALRANLLDAQGRHTLTGEFGPTPLTILNAMLVPTRGLALRSGQVQRIRFQLQLDRTAARGTLWGEYSDLKLQLLNQQEKPGLLHRLGTSVVNGIFLRDHNPRRPGQPVQPGRVLSAREPRFSVFSLWRQGLVSGMLNSAGVPTGLAKKLSEAK
ncbi:hypothetical protein HNQ93_003630 [Hymenobacter luteus]|uniref:DUF748 domain-containing protein n=2 Tax=Hymenobacter TaxID=89966 RepID=A0A7W9WDP1_9BACT|nr:MULTISPECIES: hypothetical protein [Hymenobacter]MBB4602863.1 hypothetical protein [Hymenobacter latericoloratus]MBB6060755.1 hypothetical protein [Hymenobacter luteus]